PLAACLWQRYEGTPAGSAGIPRPFAASRENLHDTLRPGRALLIGLFGGLVYWVYLPLIGVKVIGVIHGAKEVLSQDDLIMAVVQLSNLATPTVKELSQSQDGLIMALVLPAWLMQALVAAIVAALTGRVAVVHGLFAAFATAVVAFAGLF